MAHLKNPGFEFTRIWTIFNCQLWANVQLTGIGANELSGKPGKKGPFRWWRNQSRFGFLVGREVAGIPFFGPPARPAPRAPARRADFLSNSHRVLRFSPDCPGGLGGGCGRVVTPPAGIDTRPHSRVRPRHVEPSVPVAGRTRRHAAGARACRRVSAVRPSARLHAAAAGEGRSAHARAARSAARRPRGRRSRHPSPATRPGPLQRRSLRRVLDRLPSGVDEDRRAAGVRRCHRRQRRRRSRRTRSSAPSSTMWRWTSTPASRAEDVYRIRAWVTILFKDAVARRPRSSGSSSRKSRSRCSTASRRSTARAAGFTSRRPTSTRAAARCGTWARSRPCPPPARI